MVKQLTFTALAIGSLAFSYWAGGFVDSEKARSNHALGQSGDRSFNGLTEEERIAASDRDQNEKVAPARGLQDLNASHDTNERLSILLELLGGTPAGELGELYVGLQSGSAYERELFLHSWMETDAVVALEFVRIHDTEGLDLAMKVALQRSPDDAESWAAEAGIVTMAQVEYDHQKVREEEIDDWIAQANAADQIETVGPRSNEWFKDLPVKLSVEETVEEVVHIAETYSARGRHWLANSRDDQARMQAAGDIGWESNDLSFTDFEQYLQTLPSHLREAALGGYLERYAHENPGDAEGLHDLLDYFSQAYLLDQPLFLIARRIANSENGDPEVIADYIARIDGFLLRQTIEGEVVRLLGEEYFSQSASSIAMVEQRAWPSRAELEQQRALEESASASREIVKSQASA